MAVYTVSNVSGVVADYSTIQDGVNVLGINSDILIIKCGVYSENVIIPNAILTATIIFENGANMVGVSGIGLTITDSPLGKYPLGITIHNLNIRGYQYQLFFNNGEPEYSTKLINCIIDGDCKCVFGYSVDSYNCIFKNMDMISTRVLASERSLGIVENCFFDSCDNIMFFAARRDNIQFIKEPYIKNTIIKNTNFCIFSDTNNTINGYGDGVELLSINNSIENCNYKFVSDNTITRLVYEAITWVSVNSIVDIQNKTDLDATTQGFDTKTILNSTFTFNTIPTDTYYYPTSNNHYIDSYTVGAYNYAQTTNSTYFTPDANGITTNGYLERTVQADAIFISSAREFTTPQFVKNIIIHYNDSSGGGGEVCNPLPDLATDRKVGIEIMYSSTKTAGELEASPESWYVYNTGLQSETLDIDKMQGKIKSYKYRVTIRDEGLTPTLGTFTIDAITLQTLDGTPPEIRNSMFTLPNYKDVELTKHKISNILFVGAITGGVITIFDKTTGNRLENVNVDVYDNNNNLITSDITDSNGYAKFDYYVGTLNTLQVTKQGYQTHKVIIENVNFIKQSIIVGLSKSIYFYDNILTGETFANSNVTDSDNITIIKQ